MREERRWRKEMQRENKRMSEVHGVEVEREEN